MRRTAAPSSARCHRGTQGPGREEGASKSRTQPAPPPRVPGAPSAGRAEASAAALLRRAAGSTRSRGPGSSISPEPAAGPRSSARGGAAARSRRRRRCHVAAGPAWGAAPRSSPADPRTLPLAVPPLTPMRKGSPPLGCPCSSSRCSLSPAILPGSPPRLLRLRSAVRGWIYLMSQGPSSPPGSHPRRCGSLPGAAAAAHAPAQPAGGRHCGHMGSHRAAALSPPARPRTKAPGPALLLSPALLLNPLSSSPATPLHPIPRRPPAEPPLFVSHAGQGGQGHPGLYQQ